MTMQKNKPSNKKAKVIATFNATEKPSKEKSLAAQAKVAMGCNMDMFDINGIDKLSMENVEARAQIIRHYIRSENAVFFCSHSGGKDSQDMYEELLKRGVPLSRIVVIHANLGVVEHRGVIQHIEATTGESKVHVVRNEQKDFLDMVLIRGMFPSAQFRQCTSDLKTNPIDKFIRAFMKENAYTVGFNCIGIRAQESRMRAMKNPLWINKRLTLKGGQRTIYDWLPVFHHTIEDVYDNIEKSGNVPHSAYGNRGDKNTRLSCVFCIMACKNDLTHGAENYPELYHTMVALEEVVGHTMFIKKVKGEVVKVPLNEKIDVPVNRSAINVAKRRLEKRREVLLKEKEQKLQEKALKKANREAIAAKKIMDKRDPNTLEMFG